MSVGDYNEALCGEYKFGSRQVNINKPFKFKDWLDSCNVLGSGFLGLKFTWLNLRQVLNLILEMIDRCFAIPK